MKTSRIFSSALLFTMLLIVVPELQAGGSEIYELKRQVAPKQIYTSLPEGANTDIIVFKLQEGSSRPQIVDTAFWGNGGDWAELNQIISPNKRTLALRPRISMDPVVLDRMRNEGSNRIGWQLPDMSLYYEIQFKGTLSDSDRLDIINGLNALDLVEIAYFAPRHIVDSELDASTDPPGGGGGGGGSQGGPPTKETPPFEFGQYYLRQAPIGFDAYYAWSFPGGKGENVKVIDVEGGWTETHEDLHGGNDTYLIAGVEGADQDHGTAVFGIIAADSNSFGVTGIAHNVELGAVSMAEMPPAEAILIASDNSSPGDIILIECCVYDTSFGTFPAGQVPEEYNQESFDAILLASSLGRIVVQVAGNSSYDLDDTELFDSLFYPEYRFSGAIMVGSSSSDHTPDFRTSYGQRIDVHGFGLYDTYTFGYGYLWGSSADNYYTHSFSGTSGGSAGITGACAVVQSVYKEQNGTTLDHDGMRNLLTTYSVPQQEHYKHIGPMPDLAGICDAITGFVRPPAPELISPAEDAYFDAPAQPTLDWDDVPGAISYEVIIDDNFNFMSPKATESGISGSQWTAFGLQLGKYFWKVRAVNASGFGSWSEPRSLLVGVQILAPTLVSPINGAKLKGGTNFPFEWDRIDGVTDYLIEIDEDEDFSSPWRLAYAPPCTDGSCLYELSVLTYNGLYYWRVKAIGDNWPWSEVQTFTIGTVPLEKTVTEADNFRSNGVLLNSNYPNPFNPVTEISFSLPQPTHARLEIFNMLGQKVTTLVDRKLNAGEHRVTFDGSNVASGVYLYRLTAGEQVESRKMLLLK